MDHPSLMAPSVTLLLWVPHQPKQANQSPHTGPVSQGQLNQPILLAVEGVTWASITWLILCLSMWRQWTKTQTEAHVDLCSLFSMLFGAYFGLMPGSSSCSERVRKNVLGNIETKKSKNIFLNLHTRATPGHRLFMACVTWKGSNWTPSWINARGVWIKLICTWRVDDQLSIVQISFTPSKYEVIYLGH